MRVSTHNLHSLHLFCHILLFAGHTLFFLSSFIINDRKGSYKVIKGKKDRHELRVFKLLLKSQHDEYLGHGFGLCARGEMAKVEILLTRCRTTPPRRPSRTRRRTFVR